MKKIMVALAGAGMLLAGCGGGTSGTPANEPAGPPAAGQSSSAPEGGSPAKVAAKLKFEGRTLDGKAFSGASLGGKPVVLWFWAPWCPKCLNEGPGVAKAAKKYGDRVSFVGVAGLDKSQDEMRRFVSRTGTGALTQLDDRDGKLYAHFDVTSQSSFLFMKPDGTTEKTSGPLDEATLNEHIDRLLS